MLCSEFSSELAFSNMDVYVDLRMLPQALGIVIYIYIYMCVCIHVYVYMYICIYVYEYIHISK